MRDYTTFKTETIRLRKESVYKERLSFKVRHIRGVVKLTGVRRITWRLRVNKERQPFFTNRDGFKQRNRSNLSKINYKPSFLFQVCNTISEKYNFF